MNFLSRAKQAKWFVFLLYLQLMSSAFAETPKPSKDIWILVNTKQHSLSIMKKQKTIKTYKDISIGRAGITANKITQDDKTPIGRFHVSHITRKSAFHLFIGLDYPNLEHTKAAYKKGLISLDEYIDIQIALLSHKLPPQNTSLGGEIGIHGLGTADIDIHKQFNWTKGCVALTNEQIDDLQRWIQVGTHVIVE